MKTPQQRHQVENSNTEQKSSPLFCQQPLSCVFVLQCVLCMETHPVGLSGSLLSAHLNVTLLAAGAAATGDAWAPWPLWAPVCPTLIKLFSSSSSSSARKEHEEGGDWTAVALQMETNDIEEEEHVRHINSQQK